MRKQFSQSYTVDGRYKGGKGSVDNEAGLAFVKSYINRRKAEAKPNLEDERRTEDRFIVRGPGDSSYSFRNAFRASK